MVAQQTHVCIAHFILHMLLIFWLADDHVFFTCAACPTMTIQFDRGPVMYDIISDIASGMISMQTLSNRVTFELTLSTFPGWLAHVTAGEHPTFFTLDMPGLP